MKILFFPIFQMPTGHQQVADSLIYSLQQKMDVECKKIDFLHYCNQWIEQAIEKTYVQWICKSPKTFQILYERVFMSQKAVNKAGMLQNFFEKQMSQLLEEEKPDLIICTQALPSKVLAGLKRKNLLQTPVINVYTDFFVNSLWGGKEIDFHLVPNAETREYLILEQNMKHDQIFVTGIPVHEKMTLKKGTRSDPNQPHILVAGGNLGLGTIEPLIKNVSKMKFTVLCGRNEQLYNRLVKLNMPHIEPRKYISSVSEMSALYDKVDAIITKPGGVTMSECLKKRLPIFIVSYLPGQEKINLDYLKEKHLLYHVEDLEKMETQIKNVLQNEVKLRKLKGSIDKYFQTMQMDYYDAIQHIITNQLQGKHNEASKKTEYYQEVLIPISSEK